MAKQKDVKTSVSPDANRDRLTVRMDVEWLSCLSYMAQSRKLTQSDLIQTMIQKDLAQLPRTESDLIRGMVKMETGKTLRLDAGIKSTSDNPNVSGLDGAGQGGQASDSESDREMIISAPRVNPANRMAAISNIHKRTTGDPIDAAIAVSYVGDRFGNES